MRNKLLIGVLCAVMLLGAVAGAVTVGYAWLSPGKTVPVTAGGSAVASYFAGGTGTQTDPYILKTPQHVYNLAWLQYMGVFNATDANGNLEQQYFFRQEGDIDMKQDQKGVYQIVPPIGTIQNPFVGHYDAGKLDANGNYVKDSNGNIECYRITNAIVSNYITPDDKNNITVDGKPANIVERPPSVDEVRNAQIIGFFGVIGTYEEADANNNPTGTTPPLILSSTGENSQLAMVGVENLILDNVTIVTEPHAVGDGEMYSLLGLFAGFVNGTIKNIKVTSGTIAVNQGVDKYYANLVDPSITKDEAGNVIATPPFSLNITRSVSKYTLIGDYMTTRIDWAGGPLTGPTTDVGQNEGFGGSIDMITLAKRVSYMFGAKEPDTKDMTGYYAPDASISTKYNLVGHSGDQYTYSNSTSGNQFYFEHGTYLPLNIVTDNVTPEYYQALSSEVLAKNTGYLVGKESPTNWTSSNSPTINSRLLGQLCFSIKGTHTNWTQIGQYTTDMDQKLQILTKSVDGTYYVIGDDLNGLMKTSTPYDCYNGKIGVERYDSETLNLTQYSGKNNVRGKLATMLMGSASINGIQFAKAIPSASSLLTDISVQMGDQTVTSLVEGSIHFYSGKGVVTMVAATLYTRDNQVTSSSGSADYTSASSASSTSSYHYLPKLYQVDRSSGSIVLTAIDRIYVNRETGDVKYNTDPGGYEKVFDYDTMGGLNTNTGSTNRYYMNSLFYFELPVSAGEYVLGGSGNNPTYLLYLDIGGNAGSEGTEGDGEDDGNKPDYDGEISGVYFVDASGNNITQDGKTDGPAVAFDITTSNTNGTSIKFNGATTGVIDSTIPSNTTVTAVVKEKETGGS